MNEHGSSMDDIERTLPVTRRTIDDRMGLKIKEKRG